MDFRYRMVLGGGVVLMLGVLGISAYIKFQDKHKNLYEGFITTLEVQTDESTRTLARQRIATAQAAIAASEAAGEDILPDLYNAISGDALILGDLILARESLEESLTLNSLNSATWSSYGYVLVSMHDYALAKTAYLRAVELSPREETYRDAIRLLEQQFPEDKAIIKALYDDSVTTLGQKMFNMLGLANWYAEAGECDNAKAHFSVAEDLATTDTIKDQVVSERKEVLSECKE